MTADRSRPAALANADWLRRPETQAVLALLEDAGHGARAVGGSVRNSLLGTPVKDIDIATTAVPEETLRLARAAGFTAHPTGIEHGTVTIVVDHVPYEVTTLRRDIETFGRHARVTFTTDWAEDARRRDFTLNALYCSRDGTLHDPLGGYPDLVARRIRFIGDARARIAEDYLRILRFFRFFAEYGHGSPDAVGLAACAEMRGGLAQLSGERIRAELLRLLAAPRAVDAVAALVGADILDVEHLKFDQRAFGRLTAIEATLGRQPDPVLRLAALLVAEPADARHLKERLKLSVAEAELLATTAGSRPEDRGLDPVRSDERQARADLYRMGTAAWMARGLALWARSDVDTDDAARRERLALPTRWPPPTLPVAGRDVLALGVPAGPAVGEVLRAVERWWVAEDFPADEGRIAAALAAAAASARRPP